MPDILIRLDEMPQAGQSITIAENIDGSLFARLEPVGIFHPIVVIPPHGELISKDATIDAILDEPDEESYPTVFAQIVDEMPIIVPADRG